MIKGYVMAHKTTDGYLPVMRTLFHGERGPRACWQELISRGRVMSVAVNIQGGYGALIPDSDEFRRAWDTGLETRDDLVITIHRPESRSRIDLIYFEELEDYR